MAPFLEPPRTLDDEALTRVRSGRGSTCRSPRCATSSLHMQEHRIENALILNRETRSKDKMNQILDCLAVGRPDVGLVSQIVEPVSSLASRAAESLRSSHVDDGAVASTALGAVQGLYQARTRLRAAVVPRLLHR